MCTNEYMCQTWFILGEMKSIRLVQRCTGCINSVLGDANLWNNLGFSLCSMLFLYHVVATLDD